MHQLIEHRLTRFLARSPDEVFLRREFVRLGSPAQVSRVLKRFITFGVLVRIGVGVYARAKKSVLTGNPIPVRPIDVLAPLALRKLGVAVGQSWLMREYTAGRSTQIPAGLVLHVGKRRITRKLGFGNRRVQYEGGSGFRQKPGT